ncbi:transmembrane protein 41A-like [Dermacentor variabilis]|uniref:transmembrane protein 41A-like n=1 Tax=Dermacentor variabilis TaxID=34621 RepID=UPI003F5C6818
MMHILLLPACVAIGTGWLYLLTTLLPSVGHDDDASRLKFPSSHQELKELAELLNSYKEQHAAYVLVLFSSAYLYKQTFAIPGSVFLNVLAGALFGIWKSFLLTCLLSGIGASQCYLLSKFCGQKYVASYFPDKVKLFQDKVKENRDRLLYWLLFLRLFPMTPNWFLNIASPVVGVPLHLFFISVLIGLMPYNFICVQTGCILSELKSMNDILTWTTMAKMAAIAGVALLPSLLMKRGVKKE